MEVARRNLFIGCPNDKLKKYYESYKRYISKKDETEVFATDIIPEYNQMVGEKAGQIIAFNDMMHEIAHRYFKIVDNISDINEIMEVRGRKL